MDICTYSDHRPKARRDFFLRVNTQQPVTNIAKELDSLQKEFNLPSLNSSNSRHVIETLKGNAGLDASSSAGTTIHYRRFSFVSLFFKG